MTVFNLALKNLSRRPARTAAMLAGLAVISGTLFTFTFFYRSVNDSVERAASRLGADAMVVPSGWRQDTRGVLLAGGPTAVYMPEDVVLKLRQIEGVRSVSSQLFLVSARLACCSVSDTMLIGFNPEDDFTVSPWLKEHLGGPLADDEVLAGANILSGRGGRMKFFGTEFKVMGKLEPTGVEALDSAVFIPMDGARRMVEESSSKAEVDLDVDRDMISSALLDFEHGVDHERMALIIEHRVPGVRVMLADEMISTARQNLLSPLRNALIAVSLNWAAGLLLIGVMFALSVDDRAREIGLMRAMGARRGTMLLLLVYEVLVLAASGSLAGASTGAVFAYVFMNTIRSSVGTPIVMPSASEGAIILLISSAFTVTCGVAATLYSVLSASRRPPSDAVRGA